MFLFVKCCYIILKIRRRIMKKLLFCLSLLLLGCVSDKSSASYFFQSGEITPHVAESSCAKMSSVSCFDMVSRMRGADFFSTTDYSLSKIKKYMRETVGMTPTEIDLVLKALDKEGEAYYPTATHYIYIREE